MVVLRRVLICECKIYVFGFLLEFSSVIVCLCVCKTTQHVCDLGSRRSSSTSPRVSTVRLLYLYQNYTLFCFSCMLDLCLNL